MNGEYLYEALGGIAPAYVEEAEKQPFTKPLWRRVLPVAACLAMVLGLCCGFAALMVPGLSDTLYSELAPASQRKCNSSFGLWLYLISFLALLIGSISAISRTVKRRLVWKTLLPHVGMFVLSLLIQTLLLVSTTTLTFRWEEFFPAGLSAMALCVFVSAFLLMLYLWKVPKDKVSFGIPLAVLALPLVLIGLNGSPTEITEFLFLGIRNDLFYHLYFFPTLIMSAAGTLWAKLSAKAENRTPFWPAWVKQYTEAFRTVWDDLRFALSMPRQKWLLLLAVVLLILLLVFLGKIPSKNKLICTGSAPDDVVDLQIDQKRLSDQITLKFAVYDPQTDKVQLCWQACSDDQRSNSGQVISYLVDSREPEWITSVGQDGFLFIDYFSHLLEGITEFEIITITCGDTVITITP